MSDLESCVDFLQRLIQTQSLPGEEGEIAKLMRDEMERLGFADVRLDEAGNAIGRVPGRGEAEPMMFNTHLDHVDVGEHEAWPYPPFGGEVHDGKVWGRGAVDIKGPMAAQVYGVARLIREGFQPAGDVYVTGVVQEETGGLGAQHLLTHLRPPLVIVGEPSRNEIRRGHRGRTELLLHAFGKSVHASVPHEGVNPLQVVGSFVRAIDGLDMRRDPDLGASTVAPTLIRTDQISPNVVPGEVWLTCDWRSVPGESGEDARRMLQELAEASLIDGARAEVTIPYYEMTAYTGLQMDVPCVHPGYILAADHPAVTATKKALDSALGRDVPVSVWQFATDGGHFAEAGQVCVGFGPGDDLLAHTIDEHVDIAALEEALAGNEALARDLDARVLAAS
jgi:putative selenium metabolism hydrolase